MERDVMDLIKDKEFIELTGVERSEVNELCATEEEFNQMKTMLAGIGALNWSNPTPKPETKERLDLLFQQKFPKAAPVWYNSALAVVAPKDKPFYRQPLIQLAAVGLLVLLAYPFVNSSVEPTTQLAVVEKTDAIIKGKSNEKTQKSSDGSDSEGANDVNSGDISTLTGTQPISRTSTLVGSPSELAEISLEDLINLSLTGVAPVSSPGSDHPDGIYRADLADVFSAPASRQPEVFDLLTTSF